MILNKHIFIKLIDGKIESYGLSKSDIYTAISNISYIYPLGKIEDSSFKHYYISTQNANKGIEELKKMRIRVGGKTLYLFDVATVEKIHKESSTLARQNGENSITLEVTQSENGDALVIAEKVRAVVEKVNDKDSLANYYVSDDESKTIKERLNIVISNILFGIVLLTILLIFLVNWRMSAIIAIGIPTSFLISAVYFYFTGYTVNMISLVGVLIALGIVVDDAIVVSENIQRYIEEGLPANEAAYKGAREMIAPVTIASLTTMFAFIPALMITGMMGKFIMMIPIAVSSLVFASLIESFIFLPIHAKHMLNKKTKELSWERVDNWYKWMISKLMHYKKVFVTIFIILVPLATLYMLKTSKFQIFPRFDSDTVRIAIKANKNTTLNETHEILKRVEGDLLANKDKFFIKDITSITGFRRDSAGNSDRYPYVAYITIDLFPIVPQNFVDEYVTPTLSIYNYNQEEKIREKNSKVISSEIRRFIKKSSYKEQFNLTDISVIERRAGPVKTDLKIAFISNNDEKIIESIKKVEKKLLTIEGVKGVFNNATLGVDEIKLNINPYGEKLGVDEKYLGEIISNNFLSKKKGTALDSEDLLDITIESSNKDLFRALENFNFPLKNGQLVALKDIVEFKEIKAFEKIAKDMGEKSFYVYGDVDPKVITAGQVVTEIEDVVKEIRKDGVKIAFKGAKKKNQELKQDMLGATALSVTLILISLMYMFNSFKETFAVMSVIPFSVLGVLLGHQIMGINMTMPSVIGTLGLAGVVINDGIIMMNYLKRATSIPELLHLASRRLRPIVLTTVTTIIGLSTLIFFPVGQAVIFQPMAIALGFGLAWGTVLNLIYLPSLYAIFSRKRLHDTDTKY